MRLYLIGNTELGFCFLPIPYNVEDNINEYKRLKNKLIMDFKEINAQMGTIKAYNTRKAVHTKQNIAV